MMEGVSHGLSKTLDLILTFINNIYSLYIIYNIFIYIQIMFIKIMKLLCEFHTYSSCIKDIHIQIL